MIFLTILGTSKESNTDTLDNMLGLRRGNSNLDTSLVSLIHVQTTKLEAVDRIGNIGLEVVVTIAGRVLGTNLNQSQSRSTNRQERGNDNTLTAQVVHGSILESSSLMSAMASADNLTVVNHHRQVSLGAELLAILQQNLLDTREDTSLGVRGAGILGLGRNQVGVLRKLLGFRLLAPFGLIHVLNLCDTVDVDLQRVRSKSEGVLLPDNHISVHADGDLADAVIQSKSLGGDGGDGGEGQLLGEAIVAGHGSLVDQVLGVKNRVVRLHGDGNAGIGQDLGGVDGALEGLLLVTIVS